MCTVVNTIEWSGSLFYEVEGTWKDKNLIIKVVDFYLQDIGNTGSTTFENTPDLAGYRVERDLLVGVQMGLIHSHHNMQAFFSGTDMNTLKEEALDHDHFVSLVVNNRRQYVAAITSVTTVKKKMQVIEESEFTTFDGVKDSFTGESYEEEVKLKRVEYVDLAIEIQDYEGSNQDLIDRIAEVRKMKTVQKAPVSTGYSQPYYGSSTTNPNINSFPFPSPFSNPNFSQGRLPFDDIEDVEDPLGAMPTGVAGKEEDPLFLPPIPEEVIELKLKQLITLSRVIPANSKLDLPEFLKGFAKRCSASFESVKHFESFISFYVEDIIVDAMLINDPIYNQFSEEEVTVSIANLLLEELKKLGPVIPDIWFNSLYEEVEAYTRM